MKLSTVFIVLASSCITVASASNAWADVSPLSPSAPSSIKPEAQTFSGASQLGTPVVPLEATRSDRSQQLSQQAAAINQNRPTRSGQRRDLIQQVLGLPETVRVRPTRSGLGVSTQF